MATIGEVLRGLWQRSGKSQDDYAKVVWVNREHFNAVVNGREEGSPEMLEKALKDARLSWSDCLVIPPDPKNKDDDAAALRVYERALRGKQRGYVLTQARILGEVLEKTKKTVRRSGRTPRQ